MRLLIMLLLLAFGWVVEGQEVKVGKTHKSKFLHPSPNIVGQDEENFYTAYLTESPPLKLGIESFNKNTLERNYKKIIDPKLEVNFSVMNTFEHFLFMDGYFIYFVQGVFFKASYTEIYAYKIDALTGEEMPPDTLLHQDVENLSTVMSTGKYLERIGEVHFSSSKNNERLVIQYSSKDFEIDRYYEQLVVLDGELNEILKKTEIKSSKEELIPHRKVVDSEGSMYYIENGELVFLDFFQNYEEWREPLSSGFFESNAKPVGLSGSFGKTGNLVLSAFYLTEDLEDTDENKDASERREGDTQLEGIVYIEVDLFNKEVATARLNRFDQSFIDEFRTQDQLKYNIEAEVNDIFKSFKYHFTDSITLLIAEAGIRMSIPKGTWRTKEDLAIFAFDMKGRLIWSHRIPKRQEASDSRMNNIIGYFSFIEDRELHILFQDYDLNFEDGKRNINDLRLADKNKYMVPVLYSINLNNGKLNYELKKNWNSDSKTLVISPMNAIQDDVEENVIYSFRMNKRKYQPVKVYKP